MAYRKRASTEWILTRWVMACVDFRATPDDAEWIKTGLNCGKDTLRHYRLGERRIRSDVPNSVLDRLDGRFPGTAAMLRGPMAQILMRRELAPGGLRVAIRQLSDPYRTCLLALGYGADRSEIDPAVRLETALDYLLRYSAFETLEAIVFMLAWCDEIGDEIAWTTICGRYRKALPNMLFEGIPEHHHPLLDAIDDYARTIEFRYARRVRSKQSWRTAVPKARKIRKQGAIEAQHDWEALPRDFTLRINPQAKDVDR
ncbi:MULTISPECIES: hypothetical protein [Sphingomonadales]|jgi:hypothetical protein|uniref:Uncharacterized protein n=2 Tax=Erythrobacter TaxID=1041 RepID=Q2N7S4_ERYLH|nr:MULTISPECIES: hypothetical protein [Sphingomonadales]ABC64267.1 hypothetical protein ELI_10875 [Erythrobacter litoralis HTCC2594]WPZ06313.1 hypothetical protein T8T98_12965 [Pelagerythrobacter marinus]